MNLASYLAGAEEDSITLISVSYRSALFLRKNIALARAMNPGMHFHWLVVQNTPGPDAASDLAEDDPDFYVIPGPKNTAMEAKSVGYGSFQHAKAVNIAMAYCRSRFAVVLDPDCYILYPNWMSRIRGMMKRNKVCFWGTPYHPERLNSFNVFGRTYMYFPTAICLFINRRELQSRHYFELDFTPPVRGEYNWMATQRGIRSIMAERAGLLNRLAKVTRQYGWKGLLSVQRLVCIKYGWDPRKDIGYFIYKTYRRRVKYGYTPMYYKRRPPLLFSLFKFLIPQSFSAYPKRRNYWLTKPFDFLPQEVIERWEQFFFKGEPFALHVGKVTYNATQSDPELLEEILNAWIARHAPAPASAEKSND